MRVQAAAKDVLCAYQSALEANDFTPNMVTLTAPDLRRRGLTPAEIRVLTCPQYCGLFSVEPRLIIVASEQAIDLDGTKKTPHDETYMWPDFLLECVYLPLLWRFQSTGAVVARISGRDDWEEINTTFVTNPIAYYGQQAAGHHWSTVHRFAVGAGTTGLPSDVYLTDRSVFVAPNVAKGRAHKRVDASYQADMVRALGRFAKVLVFSRYTNLRAMEQIASAFLAQPVRLGSRRPLEPMDNCRLGRRVVFAKQLSGYAGYDKADELRCRRLVAEGLS